MDMEKEIKQKFDLEQIIFNLVLHGGNARALAYEALEAAEEKNFKKVEECLEEADEEFYKGHDYQNMLIQGQMDDKVPNFLVIHAQDQLMTALSEKNLIKSIDNDIKISYNYSIKIRGDGL